MGDTTVAVTHYDEYAALDNNCPHQSGPLGEGSRRGSSGVPWHGWDFDPLTGETPGPHDDWDARQAPESPFAGRKVVSVSSDGGFGQYMSEFTTAVKYDMDLTHVLLSDERGKISKEQRTGGWDVCQTDLVNPEFAAFAENCGGQGVFVDDPDDLDERVRQRS